MFISQNCRYSLKSYADPEVFQPCNTSLMVVPARTMLDPYRMEIELTRSSVDEFLSDACNELDLFVYYLDLPEFKHFD